MADEVRTVHLVTAKRFCELKDITKSTLYDKVNKGIIQKFETPRGKVFYNPTEDVQKMR